MRTLWLLGEMEVTFDLRVWPFDKALRSEDFLALNPAGRVPALEIDGRVLWETGAITEYLCDRFPDAGLGRTPDHPERAEWLIYVHFAETISQHAAALTQSHVVLREPWMQSPTIMKLEAARVGKCFDALEERLTGKWLLEGFSAADVSVGQAVYMARHFHRIGDRARLRDWFDRCMERPAFQASLPGPEEGLYRRHFYEVPEANHG